uniref:SPBc2 prophage-derived uncharacterized protein yolA n=1 Tax=Lygus hesperus TaxID=30085 RepID=A0A0A9X2K3_LYGHE
MDDIERRTPHEQQLDRNDAASNEQSAQSHLRPIPSVFPRCPYVGNEAYTPRSEGLDNYPQLVPQISGHVDGHTQQVPYFTTIVQPVGLTVASSIQSNQPRIVYAQQPVHNLAFRPYVNPVYCQGVHTSTASSYPYNARCPTQARDASNMNQQPYRPKPGSVYGIPPDTQRAAALTPWDGRCCRPYDLLLQPEAMRVFNDYKNGPPSPKDKKVDKLKSTDSNKSKSSDCKPNGSVHIGGILTLPKNFSTYNEESSQNSSASSVKDDELKPTYLQPGIMLFRKLAQAGFKDLKKIIVKYGVKSSKEDLESLCDEVRTELRSPNTGVIQMEPVLREIILAYIRICSSWSNLVSVLPMMREQPHQLEDCLSPLVREFLNWQDVSTAMLQRILDVLEVLPSEHERCISGLAMSSDQRPREPGEDSDELGSEDSSDLRGSNGHTLPVDMRLGYPPLPGYVYQSYPGCDFQLTVPRVELSPNLQLDDPVWAHLYPQLDSE